MYVYENKWLLRCNFAKRPFLALTKTEISPIFIRFMYFNSRPIAITKFYFATAE